VTVLPRWTPEEDAELLRHVDATWPAGGFHATLRIPASRVAARMSKKFGRKITKSAVIARLRRMRPTRSQDGRDQQL
jgi:hypothetical protein